MTEIAQQLQQPLYIVNVANLQCGLEINSNQAKSVIFTNLTENQAVWSFNERLVIDEHRNGLMTPISAV